MNRLAVLCLGLGVAAVAPALVPQLSRLHVASTDQLAAFTGTTPNELCCMPNGGAVCDANPEVANCGATLPHGCQCTNPGAICWKIIVDPKKHDLCVLPNPTNSSWNCDYDGDITDWCYKIEEGRCGHDAGPWSYLGFCSTCGCDYTNATTEEKGSRNVCNTNQICP